MTAEKKFVPLRAGTASWTLLGLFVCLVAGCAEPLTPEHKAAVGRMQGLGGKVVFDDGGYRLNMQASRLGDDDIDIMKDIRNLRVLDLRETRITDKGLAKIPALTSVTTVMLNGTPTSPEAREALRKQMPQTNIVD